MLITRGFHMLVTNVPVAFFMRNYSMQRTIVRTGDAEAPADPKECQEPGTSEVRQSEKGQSGDHSVSGSPQSVTISEVPTRDEGVAPSRSSSRTASNMKVEGCRENAKSDI